MIGCQATLMCARAFDSDRLVPERKCGCPFLSPKKLFLFWGFFGWLQFFWRIFYFFVFAKIHENLTTQVEKLQEKCTYPGRVHAFSDQSWSAVIRRNLATNACWLIAQKRQTGKSAHQASHTLTFAHARRSKWRTLAWCCACFLSFWSRLKKKRKTKLDLSLKNQNAQMLGPEGSPKTTFA